MASGARPTLEQVRAPPRATGAATTVHCHPASSARIPSRTCFSFSMTQTRRPASDTGGAARHGRDAGAGRRATAATCAVIQNREPRPTSRRQPDLVAEHLRTAGARSTGRGPARARCAAPARGAGIPRRSLRGFRRGRRFRCRGPRCGVGRRDGARPTSTRPPGEYLTPFDTRFCNRRRSSRRSECTTAVVATKIERHARRPGQRAEFDRELREEIGHAHRAHFSFAARRRRAVKCREGR